MSLYKVRYHKRAEKFIRANKVIGLKFMQAFEDIALDSKNLHKYDVVTYQNKDFDDVFRIRIGKYRAVFRVIKNDLIVFVFDIGSRGDIYKRC